MKKLYFLLLLFSGTVSAQIVNIPDANLKAVLLNSSTSNSIASNAYPTTTSSYIKVDANGDGEIQVSEALNVYYLHLSSSGISDLTGIEQFTNLRFLNCASNELVTIDNVNALTNLIVLVCNDNNLSSLNLITLTNLTDLSCAQNQLTTLDVSALSNLTTLYCYSNQLTSLTTNPINNLTFLQCGQNNFSTLDVSTLIHLTFLNCQYNQLAHLDVNMLTNLTRLYCNNNQLTSLDVSALTNLTVLHCIYNQLTSLDVSTLPYLTDLLCYNNNLTSFNIKNGSNETNLQFSNNPNLQFICADENQLITVQNKISAYGYIYCNVNTYCSFTPNGNYNTITGAITFDADNNGCDVSDVLQSNIRVNINDGTNTGASFTNSAANYTFYTQTGNFVVTPAVENPTWFTFSPPTATISFTNINNNVATQNFCITANGIHPDVEVILAPVLPARPGFNAIYKLVYKNKGNQTLSGNVTLTYDDSVLDYVSTTEVLSSQSVGLLTWSYANLLPFENRGFYVTFHVNAPTDIPAVNIGDVLHFTTVVNPVAGDEFPTDNTFQYNQTVVGSFDPNDITCLEGAVIPPSEIGNYLHYIINFENTGTAEAENIVVKEVIDTTKYDLSSLQILNSSHPVNAKLTNNIAEFIFKNINLDSGGHGNILLKIKSKNTLVQGDMVSKKANIYFDYNFPVTTNNADTVFQSLNTPDFPMDATISVYPNPVKDTVTITSQFAVKSVELYDVQGRLLQTQLTKETRAVLDMSTQIKGVYFIKIITEKGIKVEKVVKE